MCPIDVEGHSLDGNSFVSSKSKTQLLSESCIVECPAHVAGRNLQGHGFHCSLPILSPISGRSKKRSLSEVYIALHVNSCKDTASHSCLLIKSSVTAISKSGGVTLGELCALARTWCLPSCGFVSFSGSAHDCSASLACMRACACACQWDVCSKHRWCPHWLRRFVPRIFCQSTRF